MLVQFHIMKYKIISTIWIFTFKLYPWELESCSDRTGLDSDRTEADSGAGESFGFSVGTSKEVSAIWTYVKGDVICIWKYRGNMGFSPNPTRVSRISCDRIELKIPK